MADRKTAAAIAVACALTAGVSSCGGTAPSPAPTAPLLSSGNPPEPPLPGPGLRITGLENYPFFVTGGVLAKLSAIEFDASGREVANCTTEAEWSTSSRDFASFNALTKNQVLFHGSGAKVSADVTLTARCGSRTAHITVPMRPYRVSGTVRTPAGQPVPGVLITEIYSKAAVMTDAAGNYTADLVATPPQIVFSRPGYETHTTEPAWNAQPSVRLDVALPSLPRIVATGSGKVCNLRPTDARYAAECAAAGAVDRQTHTFTLPESGDLRVKTYWPNPPGGSGIDDNLIVHLECGGQRVYSGEIYGTQGGGFTRPAAAGTCVMTFTNITQLRVLPYEFTVNLQ